MMGVWMDGEADTGKSWFLMQGRALSVFFFSPLSLCLSIYLSLPPPLSLQSTPHNSPTTPPHSPCQPQIGTGRHPSITANFPVMNLEPGEGEVPKAALRSRWPEYIWASKRRRSNLPPPPSPPNTDHPILTMTILTPFQS